MQAVTCRAHLHLICEKHLSGDNAKLVICARKDFSLRHDNFRHSNEPDKHRPSVELNHGEKSGDIPGSIISTLRNLTRILI